MKLRILVALLALNAGALFAQTPRPAGRAAAGAADTAAAVKLREALLTAQTDGPAKALTLTQQMLVKYPAYAPALKLQGSLLEDMGRTAEAETSYEQALKLTPNDPEVLFKIGVNRLVSGDSVDALALLKRGSKLAPRDGEMLYYLAQAYHLQGDNDSALKAIEKSLALDPRDASVLQKYGELLTSSGNNLEAVERLRRAQQEDPTLARIDYDLGFASLKNEDIEAAERYAGKALEAGPNDTAALALSAEVDVKLGKWQEARAVFERLLAIHPNDATALLGLGHSELALKEYQAAVDTLQQVLQQAPSTILAHFYLSRAYAGLGRQADAAHEAELHNKLVEQAASVVPSDERKVEEATLIEARQMLTDGHEQQALQLFRARSKGPTATPGSSYMLVGVSYLYMRRPQDAERCLRKALSIEPGAHDAHTYLGLLALQRDDLAGAEREFYAELAQNANSQLAVAELGEVRYRQGRWADAAEQLVRSRTVSPGLLYMLSDAYFHLGNVKEADLAAELAVDYGKDDADNRQRIADLLTRNQQAELAQRLTGR